MTFKIKVETAKEEFIRDRNFDRVATLKREVERELLKDKEGK